MADEFTAKFKVDISDLKKNIQEANKQIKLANATFKSETAGMDKWSTNADGLSKKLEQLKSVLQNQKTVLSSYQQQLEKQQAAYEENGKRAEQLKQKLQALAEQGISKTDAEYKKYQTALKSVLKEQENNEKASDDLKLSILEQQAAVNKTEADIRRYSDSLDKLEEEERQAAEAAKKQKTAYESVQDAINKQQSKLEDLKREYANVVLEQGKNSDSAKELANEIDKLSSELQDNKKALNDADKAADELDNSLDDLDPEKSAGGFTVLKGALANLAAEGIRRCVDAIKEFAKETINIGKEFDSSMSQVAAISGATGDELQALRDKAKEMGSTTKFTASEAADAFNYMAMAGWKTEDMLGGIEGVLNLAAASGADLATTSDIVTDALTAMGYSASDAGRLADVMAAAASNANTNVEMMGSTFQYAAPIIGAMGYSMEDAALAIGLMANAGIKGDKAGTALRSTLTRLAAPPKEAADAMSALGIEITNADGTMKPFSEVIDILRGSFDGLSESQQTQYAKALAGQEAMSGLLAIVNASPEDFAKLKGAIEDSNGAAEKMAATMQYNLGGDLTKLSSQFEGVQLALYEKLEPALRSGVEALSGLVSALGWIIDNGGTIIGVITALGTAVGTYMAITNAAAIKTAALTAATKLATTAQAALNAVMNMNPIALVISLIAALVAAFIYFWNTSEEFRQFWINLWDSIKEVASAAWEAISEFFTNAWEGIKEVWGTVSEWFSTNVIEPLSSFFSDAWGAITGFFSSAWDTIQGVWQTVSDWFNNNVVQPIMQFFAPLVEWFSALFTSIWETISSTFEVIGQLAAGCVEIIKAVWGIVSEWFNENVVEPVKKFFTELWEDIKEATKAAWNKVKEIWSVVSEWFNTNVIEPVSNFFSTMWNGIKTAANTAWNKIKEIWNVVSGWFNKNIVSPVSNFFSTMWDNLKKGAKDAWQGIKDVFKVVSDWFEEKFSAAWTKVKNVFSTGGKIFDGIKEGITEAFKTVVNGIIKGINKVVAVPFNAINRVLDTLRNIEIVGITPFSGLGSISVPEIPLLAQGGVLKRGQVGLLEGSGAEAVVPLENNKGWIRAIANDLLNELRGQAGGFAANNLTNNREYNFTQIINAPKQPSRIELYRQTRNLLAYANATGSV